MPWIAVKDQIRYKMPNVEHESKFTDKAVRRISQMEIHEYMYIDVNIHDKSPKME